MCRNLFDTCCIRRLILWRHVQKQNLLVLINAETYIQSSIYCVKLILWLSNPSIILFYSMCYWWYLDGILLLSSVVVYLFYIDAIRATFVPAFLEYYTMSAEHCIILPFGVMPLLYIVIHCDVLLMMMPYSLIFFDDTFLDTILILWYSRYRWPDALFDCWYHIWCCDVLLFDTCCCLCILILW